MARIMANKTPMKKAEKTTTITDNFAALGWAAPNSFDTLTLQNKYKNLKK